MERFDNNAPLIFINLCISKLITLKNEIIMTTKAIKLIAFIALLVHGIGHFQGVVAGIGVNINNSNPASSWLLKGLSIQNNRIICLVLFLITGIIGILTALTYRGLLLNEALWQPMAIATAILSTICLVVFPNGFAMFFNKVGAIAVNLIIYYSILFNQNWPSEIFND